MDIKKCMDRKKKQMDKTNRWMVGWMDRKKQMNGWIDGQKKNRWIQKWKIGWIEKKMDGWMDKKIDGWLDGKQKKQMKQQMVGRIEKDKWMVGCIVKKL